MTLDTKAGAVALGSMWAGGVLLVGLAHMAWPSYGGAFLDLTASIYPGLHPGNGVGSVVVGALYGLVDGAVGGAAFAWLYNWASRPTSSASSVR
ncbi:MAG: hypothetical protein ABIZ70_09195 [Gemmatimonadales bacterium]